MSHSPPPSSGPMPPAWAPSPPTTLPPPGGQPPGSKSGGRTLLCVLLSTVGALALIIGAGVTVNTVANATQDVSNRSEYGPVMWRNQPAATIFPAALGTKGQPVDRAADPKQANWHRLGIDTKRSCRAALDGQLKAQAVRHGCKGVLRATYVDVSGNVVATVAVLLLPHFENPEAGMYRYLESEKHGVNTYPVPGTVAADWTNERRLGSLGEQATDTNLSYGIAAAAGSTDGGRKVGDLPEKWDIGNFSDPRPWRGAAGDLTSALNLHLSDVLTGEAK